MIPLNKSSMQFEKRRAESETEIDPIESHDRERKTGLLSAARDQSWRRWIHPHVVSNSKRCVDGSGLVDI